MRSPRLSPLWVTLAALLALAAPPASAQTKLLRFPDVHGDKVVFTYAGDLWVAPSSGGTATRLTAHPGLELFAKFSPDGKWIAFTGQYDGDEQVYIIPAIGGVPKQLTFYPARGPLPARWGYDNQVYGWTPDGKRVLFRSLRDGWDLGDSRLYTVSVDGGLPVALPMPVSGAGDFSPDGKRVVYSPLSRDFRTWKRYQGGWAQDLYIFDLASHQAENITNNPRTDRDPMWIGSKIYFASDRDGKLNLYVYDPASKQTSEMTHSREWDVRWPSADEQGQIVYELGGELNIFDTGSGQSRHLSILVPDDGVSKRPARVSAEKQIEDFELSPDGHRALFVARGDIFTAPIEHGPTRNLTDSSNAHDKWARWSPDGAKIAFISDRTGEEELYLINQDGSGGLEQLTHDGHAMRYAPRWSPDGKRLAFSDKDGKLYILTLADKKVAQIADDTRGQVRDYAWSPHGGYLAFSLGDPSGFRSLYIWNAADDQVRRITGELYNEYEPTWDPDGNYLYYLSDREFAPQIGSFEWNYQVNRETQIFALALRKDVKPLFPPRSDEVVIKAADEAGGAAQAEKPEKKAEPIQIDFDGLADRVMPLPVDADNYYGLQAIPGHLLYVSTGAFFYGRERARQPELHIFSLKDRKESTLAENIQGYAASGDGSKVLARHRDGFKLYDANPKGKDSAKPVSTKGLMVDRIPAEEWAQIFDEVWRRYRDFFYVPNMNGYDWVALRAQYRPLLAYVAHRSDLNYVIGEMIAELSNSHAYIAGGDYEIPTRPKVALPGARFALDPTSGRYRIARIFTGQNEEERYRAPLTEIGVDAHEGDYVLAINGEELRGTDNPYRLLRNQADHPVELTLNSNPTLDGARKVSFEPRTSEDELIYLDWVTRNRQKVAEMTGGRVGYLHLPDMGADGIREFIKYFYGQIRKQGLIIDVRGNGGGNVSQMIIERLRRTLLGTDFARNDDQTGTYPATVFYGHLVCLLNETSASDGDIFPYMFRQAGLGPLIGKRSWGGVVGITNRGPLIDGGTIYVPEFATASADGQWVIEGHGVDPDIVVANTPESVIEGKDLQLDRGVAEVMKAIQEKPMHLPPRPPAPNKNQP